jgi:DNA polymerase elongation subunit (family B)
MLRYHKTEYIKSSESATKKDLDFQICEWWCQDDDDGDNDGDDASQGDDKENKTYNIRCFGVTKEGVSVTCKITGFKPYYYIKVSSNFNKTKMVHLMNYIESSYALRSLHCPLSKKDTCIVEKKDLFGFRNGKTYKFVKLVFSNYTSYLKSRYIFKKPVSITGVTSKPTKFKLYESNFEPFMRLCHIKDILMAGWIRLPVGKYKSTIDEAHTQIEVEIKYSDVVSLKEKQEVAKLLQASWDIEVYSHDYSFPDPKKKVVDGQGKLSYPNEIFQIATTYKYYGDDGVLVKHLLTLKKCAPIHDPSVVVEECKDERDLIKKWVDTISLMDPDIFYTYNGDSFDCIYLKERASVLGLENYVLNKLSRLTSTPATIKKEFFSSSAYGDSEFYRLYVPGRLNYDLLIHYKRGMKKYPSYKLDYIAGEILKEGKHDISAKQIFGYYEQGTPELIREISRYCIQDTDLLQKLVDKQLILTNIIQLANVTYVPIGFLSTRGQTIKVYSQVLRKARQMDFLVPHTNFNEDNYPINVKTKDPHPFSEEDLNEYITLDVGFDADLNKNVNRRTVLSCRLSEIVDENNIVVLCDTEIPREYYNRKIKYKFKEIVAARVWPCEDAIDDSFTGATVLEPNPGMYFDNIAVLDFASLYPTVEISRNLCFSTLVMDDKYRDIPGVNYELIEWDDKVEYKLKQTCGGIGKSGKSKGQVCGKPAFFEIEDPLLETKQYYCRIHDTLKKSRHPDEKVQKKDVRYSYTIVQPHKDEHGNVVNKGVVPALLEELYAERKKVKKQMTKAFEEGNKLLEDILNSTQLAIKVSLNSVYGFVSRNQGNLILKPLGQLTTAVGRMLIEQSKQYAEERFVDYVKENGLLNTRVVCIDTSELAQEEKERFLKMKMTNF